MTRSKAQAHTNGHAPPAEPEFDLSARLRATVEKLLGHLESQIAVVDKRLAELTTSGGQGFDVEVSRAGAALARAIEGISGELRQLDKHDAFATNTPEKRWRELLKYVRTLDMLQLGELSDVVAELQSGRAA